jgi:HSP20 family protein
MGSWLWSPFWMMRRMTEEMDRLAGDMWSTLGEQISEPETGKPFSESEDSGEERSTGGRVSSSEFGRRTWTPDVEIVKRGDQVVVRVDLPGVAKDDLHVDYDDDSVTVRGVRREPKDEHPDTRYRSERTYGSFYRNISLPTSCRAKNASATFRDGVLEIVLQASNGGQSVDVQ